MFKGLAKIKENNEQIQNMRNESKNEIDVLKLVDGDYAKIRILSDSNEVIKVPFHSKELHFPSGKTFTKMIYCSGENDCGICGDNEGEDDIRETRSKLILYIYVYEVAHKQNNPDKDWKKDSETGKYIETVNKPMLLMTGRGNQGYIENTFIEYWGKYKTLSDRDYIWGRKGSGLKDTLYSLTPEDKSKIPGVVLSSKEKLKPLETIIKEMYPEGDSQVNPKINKKSEEDTSEDLDRMIRDNKGESLFD